MLRTRVLGAPVTLRAREPGLLDRVAAELSAILAPPVDGVDLHVNGCIDGEIANGVEIDLDEPLAPHADPVQVALTALTAAAVSHSTLFCSHAGVVLGGTGVIAVPGQSGLGKTTLTATLVRAGFGYLSDEVLALDRRTHQVTGFRRPFAVAADVWPLLTAGLPPGTPPAPGQEQLIPPAALGAAAPDGGTVSEVLLATRRPGPVTITPGSPARVVQALLNRSFNHHADPGSSFAVAVALARTARAWIVGYQEADQLATALADRFGLPEY